jgi:hypothetical protein
MNEHNEPITQEEEVDDIFEEEIKIEKKQIDPQAQAELLVSHTKHIVAYAEEQTETCKVLLSDDLKEYEEGKSSLKIGGLDACVILLESMGSGITKENASPSLEDKEISDNAFDTQKVSTRFPIKEVSNGKFTGVIFGLLGGIIGIIAMVYLATEMIHLTLDVTQLPTPDMIKIFSWFSSWIGVQSPYAGGVILFLMGVGIALLIYFVRIHFKAKNNLEFATEQLIRAEAYTEEKKSCKAEMDKVDRHMKDTVVTLKTYEVLLNEQKGKLQRILYLEGVKSKTTEYHTKSFAEIRETKLLVDTISQFIAIPISIEGELSQESLLSLEQVRNEMKKGIDRLY